MKRSSLKQIVNLMQITFQAHAYELLSIVHNERGNYYTLMTEEELITHNNRPVCDHMRLVCRLSRRELAQFAKTVNLELFPKEVTDQNPPDHNSR